MSKPKRFSVAVDDPWFGDGAYITEEGKYVLWDDYAALAAENERLKAKYDMYNLKPDGTVSYACQNKEIAELKAQIMQLRVLGCAVANDFNKEVMKDWGPGYMGDPPCEPPPDEPDSVVDWFDYIKTIKEGGAS